MNDTNRQYIDFLAACHYFGAALAFIFGLVPMFHVVFGIGMFASAFTNPDPAAGLMTSFMGFFFLLIGGMIILSFWAYGYGMIKAAQYLKQRERYVFCMVMAAVSCIFVPIGTVLGIFTIIVLIQDDVKADFGVLETKNSVDLPPAA